MSNNDKKVGWIHVNGENANIDNLKPEIAQLAQDKIDQYMQAVSSARANQDRHEEAVQLDKLGGAYFNLGHVNQAIECYEEALSIFHELGDQQQEAAIHTSLGFAHIPLKDVKNIHEHYMQAWQIYDKIGDKAGVAKELRNLASFYEIVGQPDKAVDFYKHALAISSELGDQNMEATTLGNLGVIYMELGHLQEAIELHEQSLELYRRNKNRRGEISILINLGTFYLQSKQWDRALEHNNEALSICRELGERDKEALILKNNGLVRYGMKQIDQAIDLTRSAIRILEDGGYHGVESARRQLEHLSNAKKQSTPRFIRIPIGLLFMLVFALIVNFLNRCSRPATPQQPIVNRPPTGTLAGMVLNKNRQPLVNTEQGELGIIALLCSNGTQNVECLDENEAQMDGSALFSSICEANDPADTCLLHWGQGAAQIDAKGSYIMRNIPTGEYDLLLIIFDSGIAMSVHIKNVDPVQANQITYYEFVTQ